MSQLCRALFEAAKQPMPAINSQMDRISNPAITPPFSARDPMTIAAMIPGAIIMPIARMYNIPRIPIDMCDPVYLIDKKLTPKIKNENKVQVMIESMMY